MTGRDLAQACRDHYSRPVAFALWILCEIAIAACDLAEVIGSAIALNLLFGIPLPWGIAITALDVLLVLYLQNKGFRLLEALVIALIVTDRRSASCSRSSSRGPTWRRRWRGFIPTPDDPAQSRACSTSPSASSGATVMPHNLYLHSSIVQTRRYEETPSGKREAVRFAFIDSTIALSLGAVHQRRDPDRRRRHVPSHRPHRGGRDPGRLQAADAAARAWPAPARCSPSRCSPRGRTRP